MARELSEGQYKVAALFGLGFSVFLAINWWNVPDATLPTDLENWFSGGYGLIAILNGLILMRGFQPYEDRILFYIAGLLSITIIAGVLVTPADNLFYLVMNAPIVLSGYILIDRTRNAGPAVGKKMAPLTDDEKPKYTRRQRARNFFDAHAAKQREKRKDHTPIEFKLPTLRRGKKKPAPTDELNQIKDTNSEPTLPPIEIDTFQSDTVETTQDDDKGGFPDNAR